jgi:iron(III) transport system ATP-binding protein
VAERVRLEGATKVFANKAIALEDVTLEAEPGEFVVLLGPSGSGKTTLLRLVAGIERLTSGRLSIGNTLVDDSRAHVPSERRGLSMVFQDYALWPHLSVVDNVAFALRRKSSLGGRSPRSTGRRAQAREMLARVGLADLAERFPSQLSGGEQQRVALARALVGGVGLVLFDEPLSNLDADLRDRMRLEIATLVRESGATALYITHDQSEAFALADRIGVLEKGRLVQFGAPEEVYRWPASPFVARFTGAATEFAVNVLAAATGGARVEVAPPAHPEQVVAARSLADLAAGPALLLVRPGAVRLCEAGDGAHMSGSVSDVAFRGRGYELAVDLSDGHRISNIASPTRVARGEIVGLRFDEAGCVVFADTAARPVEPARPVGAARLVGASRPVEDVRPVESAQPLGSPGPPESAQPGTVASNGRHGEMHVSENASRF